MTWPTHNNPSNDNNSIAPYNFVPLPEKVFLNPDDEENTRSLHGKYYTKDEGRHTGWIDLKIKAETPLYTRCAFDPALAAKKVTEEPVRQQFFHHGDPNHPFIPGSSLRGMVRSLVEVIGCGKMQWVKDEKLVYRAVGDTTSFGQSYREKIMGKDLSKKDNEMHFEYPSAKLKGGYLEKSGHGWAIRPAMEPNGHGESFIHVSYHSVSSFVEKGSLNVYEVYVRPRPRCLSRRSKRDDKTLYLNLAETDTVSQNPKEELVAASLVVSGHMGGEHEKHWHCAIYEPNPASAPVPIPDTMWNQYEEDTKLSRSTRTETRKLKNNKDPLFYLLDDSNNLVYFGSTVCFRLPYNHSTLDFVPESLKDEAGLDIAESLFGTVKKKGKLAVKGRVSFEDAEWKNTNGASPFFDDANNGRRIPKILSGPKPTSFQHYLVQPEMAGRKERMHYNSAPVKSEDGDTVIRGHKLYWHKNPLGHDAIYEKNSDVMLKQDETGIEPLLEKNGEKKSKISTQHTVIRPVRKDVEFASRIHFENVSAIELGALLTALKLTENMRHKLGMGKPLGMGSVQITATLHVCDRKKRYETFLCARNEESESETQQIEKTAKEHFMNALLMHQGAPHGLKDIWDFPRFKALAALLEWKHPPDVKQTSYVGIGKEENGNQWRMHKILPTPLKVSGIEEPLSVKTTPIAKNNPLSSYFNAPGTKSPIPVFYVGGKVSATVVSNDKGNVTVRLDDGSQFSLKKPYFPSLPGTIIKVKIKTIDASGMKITGVNL